MGEPVDLSGPRLFRRGQIAGIGLLFVLAVLGLNSGVRQVRHHVVFDCPSTWPISEAVIRRPDGAAWLTAAATAVVFATALVMLERSRYRLSLVVFFGVALLIAGNLIQGWTGGLLTPVAGSPPPGGAVQYYHDAAEVTSASAFLRSFNAAQPSLRLHSRTHPPGAVLVYYWLAQMVGPPWAIAVAIALVSGGLSAAFLWIILGRGAPGCEARGRAVFLFMLVPSVHVYYLASLDALIATAVLAAWCSAGSRRLGWRVLGGAAALLAASFMTFAAVFALPVMLAAEIAAHRRILGTCLATAAVAAGYVVLRAVFGFDYAESFLLASMLENPRGFMAVAEPASYVFTRLECVGDVLVFLGPFLLVLLVRGLRRATPLRAVVWTALATTAALLAVGVFRTGETARAALFVYPLLLAGVAAELKVIRPSMSEWRTLAALVFGQAVAMQLAGDYFW